MKILSAVVLTPVTSYQFFAFIGVPEGLSNIGVDDTHFKAMAKHACAYNPLHKAFIPLNESDVETILRQSL